MQVFLLRREFGLGAASVGDVPGSYYYCGRGTTGQMSEEQTQNLGNDNQILRQILTKLEVMDTRIQFVETKVTERGYDTKPIWERTLSGIMEVQNELGVFKQEVKKELGGLKQEFGELKQEFGGLKQEFGVFKQELGDIKHEIGDIKHQLGHVNHELGDVKRELALVNKKIDVFNGDMLKLRAEQLETEARMRHLEG